MNTSSPVLPPLPFNLSFATPVAQKPDYQLVIERLPWRDAETEYYQLSDIEPLIGIKAKNLCPHAKALWPTHTGHWHLTFEQACKLIRRAWFDGRPKMKRQQLEAISLQGDMVGAVARKAAVGETIPGVDVRSASAFLAKPYFEINQNDGLLSQRNAVRKSTLRSSNGKSPEKRRTFVH